MKKALKPVVDCLEARLALAGSVTASLTAAGELRISGDGRANNVAVDVSGPNWIVTGGTSFTGDEGTKINNALNGRATFQGVRSVSIDLGAGNNTVNVRGFSTQLDSLAVTVGDDYDTVNVSGVRVQNGARLTTAGGDDKVSFIQSFARDLLIDLGDGNNSPVEVGLTDGQMETLTINAATRRPGGRDGVNLYGVGDRTVVKKIAIRTGLQDDQVRVASLRTSFLYVHGGKGNDTLTLTGLSFYGERRLEAEGVERVN